MLSFLDGRDAREIAIEIVGFCNAECTFCPAGVGGVVANTKFMRPDIFESIVDNFLEKKIISAGYTIGLFFTSEAFLHPKINDIFDILEKRNLKANISSNFMYYPKLNKKHFKNIGILTFSLSSFQKERYKSVYGGDINRTLDNFNKFLHEIKVENANILFQVNWIRYRYNIDEEETAINYFSGERGLKLNFVSAILLDIERYVDILEKGDKIALQESDNKMFLSEQLKIMEYVKNIDAPFLVCSEFSNIVIDVEGNWIMCCRTTDRKPQHILGSYKDVNIDTMRHRTTKGSDICRFCSSYYLPDSAYLVESATKFHRLLEKIMTADKTANYAIYGIGHLAQVLYSVFGKNGVSVDCFIDDFQNGELFNVEVISLELFAKNYFNKELTVVIAATNANTIKKLRDKISLLPSLENLEIISI